jgi:hypothetical protein
VGIKDLIGGGEQATVPVGRLIDEIRVRLDPFRS